MKKKLLVYCWGSVREPLLCKALDKLGWEYVVFTKQIRNYHADGVFGREMIEMIHSAGIQAVFSYDYFPMISMICEINKLPYLSWVYDCPQYTLQSKTLINSCNYIFCFDRAYALRLQKMGAVNCIHYPLAADEGLLDQIIERERQEFGLQGNNPYRCDISFLGNLYNEDKNRLRRVELTPYTQGYVEALIESQILVYGSNFLKSSLTDEAVKEIVQGCELRLGEECIQDDRQMAADAMGMEISARERERVLQALSALRKIKLYTSSKLPGTLEVPNLQNMGYADYEKEVPLIFHNSRINLNITSKTIESGVPQRVFDILSCGGFCLTNYQPEIAELFEDGVDLVMYGDIEDMVRKADYYLTHEEERAQVAQRGHKKAVECYGLISRVREMMHVAEEL